MKQEQFTYTGQRFNGPAYDAMLDNTRLGQQIKRVFDVMWDHAFRTLAEIREITGDPEASISAQLRHLIKPRFGSFVKNKQRRGDEKRGLWEYQILPPGA